MLPGDQHWGADPGISDIFTVTNSLGTKANPSQVRKYSGPEHYHNAGFNRSTSKREKWKLKRDGVAVQAIESLMPTRKTASLELYLNYVTYVTTHLNTLMLYYNARFRLLKLYNYRGSQLALNEAVRMLTFGSRKYGNPDAPFMGPVVDKYRPARPADFSPDHRIIVGYGDARVSPMGKGNLAGPNKKLLQRLKMESRRMGAFPDDHPVVELRGRNRLEVVMVGEWRTSLVDSEWVRSSDLFRGDEWANCLAIPEDLHLDPDPDPPDAAPGGMDRLVEFKHRYAVKRSRKSSEGRPQRLWNRDVNASRNILTNLLCMLSGRERPAVYSQ